MGEKVKCIEKFRDNNGNIVGYKLEDQAGNRMDIGHDQLKVELKKNKYNVENLQIDKAGRLVDKKVESVKLEKDNSKKSTIKANELALAFERCYKAMCAGNDIHFGYINRGDYVTFDTEKEIERACRNVNIDEENGDFMMSLASKFEQFISKKNNNNIMKIGAKSKDGKLEFVCYTTTKGNIPTFHYIAGTVDDGKTIDANYYANEDNYIIFGGYLNNSMPSVLHKRADLRQGKKDILDIKTTAEEIRQNSPYLLSVYGEVVDYDGNLLKNNGFLGIEISDQIENQRYRVKQDNKNQQSNRQKEVYIKSISNNSKGIKGAFKSFGTMMKMYSRKG